VDEELRCVRVRKRRRMVEIMIRLRYRETRRGVQTQQHCKKSWRIREGRLATEL
jgi:hypothetical protein